MKGYSKIETLYDRDEKFRIVPIQIRKEEFKSINRWLITEKIDGTNIRIGLDRDGILSIAGRTDRAEVPLFLMEYLKRTFTAEKLKEVFWEGGRACEATLYCEGYGNRIQGDGSKYTSKEVSAILFDCLIDNWWLEYDSLKEIADNLGIKVVPNLGIMSMEEAVKLIGKKSEIAEDKEFIAEGIVATAYPMVLFRSGNPIKWKLKVRDFREGKKEE